MEKVEGEKKNILFAALTLLNKPGVLEKIAEILARHGVNILSGIHYGPSGSRESVWFFSADFTNADASHKKIFREIEKLDPVLLIEYGVKKYGSILLPPFSIELNVLDTGIIVQEKTWIREVNKAIVEELGTGGEALVFHMGFKAGYKIVDYWAENTGLSGEMLIPLIFEIMKIFNWIGDYKIVKFNLKKSNVVFRVWNLMDCESFKNKMDKPTSHYFRGVISGFMSRISGEQLVFIESRCVAKGEPFCEFKIA